MSTQETIDRLVAELADHDGNDVVEAERMVRSAGLDVVFELAAAALLSSARHRRRAESLREERRATANVSDLSSELAGPRSAGSRPRVGTAAYWEWVEATEEGRAYNDEREEWQARRMDSILSLSQRFADDLRMTWTEELLASSFSLQDGTRVSWGEASVDQHRERASMFSRNAAANAEGAARHLHAIAAIEESGAGSLSEAVAVAA